MVDQERVHPGSPSGLSASFMNSIRTLTLTLFVAAFHQWGVCQLQACGAPPWWNLNMTLNILVTQLRDTSFKPKAESVEIGWISFWQLQWRGKWNLISLFYISANERGIDHSKALLLWFHWPILNAWQGYEIHYHYLDLIKPNRSISTY